MNAVLIVTDEEAFLDAVEQAWRNCVVSRVCEHAAYFFYVIGEAEYFLDHHNAADWRAFMDEITGEGSASAGRAGTAALVMTDVGTRRRLLALKGSVRFELRGLGGRDWNLVLGLRDASRDEPGATISMNVDDYRALLDGKLDPMQAFMQGKTKLAGDVNLAMQYGMALLPLFQPASPGAR